MTIPDICHMHHMRCRCQNFKPGVKKLRIGMFWWRNLEFCVFFVQKSGISVFLGVSWKWCWWQISHMNMTQVTINVSLSSGHSEGELYFLEGERGKALGVEHRSPPRFRRPKLTAFQERMGSDASWGGSSRCFSGHRRIKDKPHNLVQVKTNVKKTPS